MHVLHMIHDQCIIRTYTIVAPTNVHMHIKISIYTTRIYTRTHSESLHVAASHVSTFRDVKYKVYLLDKSKLKL